MSAFQTAGEAAQAYEARLIARATEGLQAEVARLREGLVLERQVHSATAAALNAERAAHEATQAELAMAMDSRGKLQARVAELERDLAALRITPEDRLRDNVVYQARDLLVSAYSQRDIRLDAAWVEAYRKWLAAFDD